MNTTWTREQIEALGVRTDLVTACQIVYGVGRTRAYEMHAADELHFPALRAGHRIICPVQPILELLGLGGTADKASGYAEVAS